MKSRLQKIQKILEEKKLDGIFVSTPANITYLTNFHFLVEDEREAFLLITQNKEYIITSELYKGDIEKHAPEFQFINFYKNGESFWEFINKTLSTKNKKFKLGFESDNITVAEYTRLKKLKGHLITLDINNIRDIKDKEEIQHIKDACALTDKAFAYALSHIKADITEKELAFILDTFIRKNGSEPSFASIVAFGENSAIPHHTVTDTKLKSGDTILMDFGAKVQNYSSDMSRTVFFGKPNTKQVAVYNAVKKAQQKAIDYIFAHATDKTQLSAKRLDKIARDSVKKAGFPEFSHSLGHSVGIKVHDGFALSPYSMNKLTLGMVFTIEPGIYLPGEFGVRIEDVIALTDKGPEILTKSPKELIIL